MPARLVLFTLLFLAIPAPAERPSLDFLFPAGAPPGSTNVISTTGKAEPWPPQVWVQGEGVVFTAETNKNKFQVVVATNAAPGPRLVRLFNQDGASEPKFFVVGHQPELADAEPNDHFLKAQPIPALPVTINGRLDKNRDADSFALQLKSGDWLDAQLDSHVLMSTVDAVLRLIDQGGYQLAFTHDYASLDPRLIWQSPIDQTVILQVYGFLYPANNSVNLSGGDGAIYRLHLRSTREQPSDFCAPLSSETPESDAPPTLTLGKPVHARIDSGTDLDRFAFEARKGVTYRLAVSAASKGSALDAWLKIEDSTGKEIVRNDDANSRDPALEWAAPADGRFTAVIGSLTHRGGAGHDYELALHELLPDFEPALSATSLLLAPGETNQLKFNVKLLRGFTNELNASILDLPPGLHADSLKIPEKGGEITFALRADTNAPPWNGPIRISVADSATNKTATFPFVSRSENNGVPGGYTSLLIEDTDLLWLTVRPAPEIKAEEKK